LVRQSLSLDWERHLELWQEQIVKINGLIANVNLKQPGEKLEILKLTLESELARAGAGRQLD
jgi:starvation-inducible outer membrane lipoprotein